MFDFETALQEMTETEESVADMALSDKFHREMSRIRLDLGVSPHLPLTDEMCKWVVLAYIRSASEYAVPSKRKPLTDEEIEDLANEFLDWNEFRITEFARAIERVHGIGGEE